MAAMSITKPRRPFLDQMAEGFARLTEGIAPLDNRLD
jgi:hypothetical protein